MRLVAESHDVVGLVFVPEEELLDGSFDVEVRVVSAVDKLLNVIGLESDDIFERSDSEFFLSPRVKIGLLLSCRTKCNFS